MEPTHDEPAIAAELVRRIRAGDRQAEAELVERYRSGLLDQMRPLAGASAPSEDLCQDTLRLTLEKARAGHLRDPARLKAFLYGTGRNLIITWYRRQRAHEPAPEPEAELPLTQELPEQLKRILRAEEADLVQRVLNELPERDRQVLYLYYIAGEDKEYICAVLGLSSSRHLSLVLFRARQRFRQLYEMKGRKDDG